MNGPFETAREAWTLPQVKAVHAAFDADPGAGKMQPHTHRLLCSALETAGVELGAYDHHIALWLSGWEPHVVAVIAAWVIRAHQAAGLVLDEDQRAVVLDALDVAAGHKKDLAEVCGDCEVRPDGGLCETCEWRMHQIAAYEALANTLRETSP